MPMQTRFHTNETNLRYYKLLFYAFLTGTLVGTVSAAFRISLNYIEQLRNYLFSNVSNNDIITWFWPFLFITLGVSLSIFLVRKFAPETVGSGIQEIEGALDGLRPLRWKRVIPVKFIASLCSLGSGMLLGREGPTVQMGANIGKMVKDQFAQETMKENPLISAGAAAGLASAFNAPFAGIMFVIEEMHEHFKWNFFSVAAIMIGAGSADAVLKLLISSEPSIQMTIFTSPKPGSLWLFIILGALFSFLGYLFNYLLVKSLDYFVFLNKKPVVIIALCIAAILTIAGVFFPEMIGGGYQTITKVLEHSFSLTFLLLLLTIRMIFTILGFSSGVSGGIFVPMLTLGIILGMFYGSSMQYYFPTLITHPEVFGVAGMAAIFAATVRAPLTGLVLAVEMTSNYELILPLIITTATASVLTTLMGNKPIYATLLARTLGTTKP